LLQQLQNAGIALYAITNNVKEIMDYHRIHSDFVKYFKAIVVSAEVGVAKPELDIYQTHCLNKYSLDPKESVFIDDAELNVIVAEKYIGMHVVHFKNTESCKQELMKLGIPLVNPNTTPPTCS
jgi:putative hydrolase of the HAD superfamily